MRCIPLLLIGAALASCSITPQPETRGPGAQRDLDSLLAGKVAAPPINCLQDSSRRDMTTIDGQTVAYRDGGYTTYLVHLSPGCREIGTGNAAMLTRSFGTSNLCRGDIVQALDNSSRMIVGSCTVAEIVPYHRLR